MIMKQQNKLSKGALHMGSNSKAARLSQMNYWEAKLEQRIKRLSESGKEPQKIPSDPVVRKIRAKIRETQARIRAIEEKEKKNEELARQRTQKTSKPKKEKFKKKKGGQQKQELSKRQQKKLKKKEQKAKS